MAVIYIKKKTINLMQTICFSKMSFLMSALRLGYSRGSSSRKLLISLALSRSVCTCSNCIVLRTMNIVDVLSPVVRPSNSVGQYVSRTVAWFLLHSCPAVATGIQTYTICGHGNVKKAQTYPSIEANLLKPKLA